MKSKLFFISTIFVALMAIGCTHDFEPVASPTANNSTLFSVAEKVSKQSTYVNVPQACKFDVANSSVAVTSVLEKFLLENQTILNTDEITEKQNQKKADLQEQWLEYLRTQNETNLSPPKSCPSPIDAGMLSIDMLNEMSKVISSPVIKSTLNDFIYIMCKQASMSSQQKEIKTDNFSNVCSTTLGSHENQPDSSMRKLAERLYGTTEN